MYRYVFFLVLGLFLAGSSIPSEAVGEETKYPTKPITIVNSFGAGGGLDAVLRPLAKLMQDNMGQPVIVENKTGGTGLIGGDYVARAKPDGYTLGGLDTSVCVPEAFEAIRKPPYVSTDLDPLIRLLIFPHGLMSRSDMPWKDIDGFIKYVQTNPNKVKVGHFGFGHFMHILFYSLAKTNKLEVIEIPFKGGDALKAALLGGHIDVAMTSPANVLPFLQNGQLKMLAIHNSERVSDFPDAPTFRELNVLPRFPLMMLNLFAPKGTPQDVKKKLHDTAKQAMETSFYKEVASKNYVTLYYGTPEQVVEDDKIADQIVRPLSVEIAQKYKF